MHGGEVGFFLFPSPRFRSLTQHEQVYAIPLGGSMVKQPFAIGKRAFLSFVAAAEFGAGGSGSTYIYGWVDANYREGMALRHVFWLLSQHLCCCCCFNSTPHRCAV